MRPLRPATHPRLRPRTRASRAQFRWFASSRFPAVGRDIARPLSRPAAPDLRSRPSLRSGASGMAPPRPRPHPPGPIPTGCADAQRPFLRTHAARAAGIRVEPGSDFRRAEDPHPSSHRALGIPDPSPWSGHAVDSAPTLRPRLFRARKSLGLFHCRPRPGSEARASKAVTPLARSQAAPFPGS